ncbi:MAG: winged helix-turn-helix domain-containing protein [Deltaproteobacteria bacterium]|nr:winged helix-turn-helix domain-containing protein [Deltaproteobacteria bacterium]
MSKIKLSKRAKLVLGWIKRQAVIPDLIRDPAELPIRQQTLADLLGCSRRSIYRALKQLKEQGYLKETGKRQKRCKVYGVLSKCRSYRAHREDVNSPGPCELSAYAKATADKKLAATQATDNARPTAVVDNNCHDLQRCQATGASGALIDGSLDTERHEMPNWVQVKEDLCPLAQFHLDNCRNIFRYNFPESFDWEKHFAEATHKIRHVEHQTKFWRLMFDNLYLIQERETGKPHSARVDNPDSTLFGVSYPKEPPPGNIDHILKTRPAYR